MSILRKIRHESCIHIKRWILLCIYDLTWIEIDAEKIGLLSNDSGKQFFKGGETKFRKFRHDESKGFLG